MKTNILMFKRIRENRLFWPLVALALILVTDAIFAPGFFKIGILNGHLYGNLIDVINNSAPLMLVALGMTLVIATGGVDLSVGAVIAISAAMGAVLINPALGNKLITNDILTKDATNTPLGLIILADLAAGTLCGLWNGLRFQGKNPTHGGDTYSYGSWSWHCPVDYKWADYDHLLHPLLLFWKWIYSGAACVDLYCGNYVRSCLAAGTEDLDWSVH